VACVYGHRERNAVFHQRRRFQSARGAEFAAPGQAQLADVFLVDLFQRTESVVVVSPLYINQLLVS